MKYIDISPKTDSNENDTFSSFLESIIKKKVTSYYKPFDFLLSLTIDGKPVVLEIPFAQKVTSFYGEDSLGYQTMSSGKTKRFFRARLQHKNVNPFLGYGDISLHLIPGDVTKYLNRFLFEKKDEFYIAEFWVVIAEIIASVHKEGDIVTSFNKKFNSFYQKQELIKTEWASFVMSQELSIGVPEKEECAVNFKQEAYQEICRCFQTYALSKGYSLSATSKSKPGSVVTRGLTDKPSKRTLLSLVLMPSSCQRWCRAPREQRGIRESIRFFKPRSPNIYLKGYSINPKMLPYVHNSATLIMDTKHSVPSVEDGPVWNPDKSRNKDRIMITPEGSIKFRAKERVRESLTEERFYVKKSLLEKKPGYVFEGEDIIRVEKYYSKRYNVSYDNIETKIHHAKLISITGLKGVSEPIQTRFYASHLPNLETLNISCFESSVLESLIEKKILFVVETIISASGVYSKRSDALVHQAVLSRMAYEDELDRQIPLMKATEWVHPDRSTEVDTNGHVTKEYDDYVNTISKELESRGQDPDGLMYVYKIAPGENMTYQKDEEGNPLKAIFGFIPFFRTRHSDDYGGETQTFKPNDVSSDRHSGVSYDIHIAKLGNMEWFLPEAAKTRIDNMADSIKRLQKRLDQGH